MAFPRQRWTRIYSTNPLERLNKEVRRRTDVVGIFPDQSSVQRLVGSVLMEIDDEWQVARPYFRQKSMRKLTQPQPEQPMLESPLRLAGRLPDAHVRWKRPLHRLGPVPHCRYQLSHR